MFSRLDGNAFFRNRFGENKAAKMTFSFAAFKIAYFVFAYNFTASAILALNLGER